MLLSYHSIWFLASAVVGALARPTQDVLSSPKPRPLVIWHGLGESLLPRNGDVRISDESRPEGDTYSSPGQEQFQSAVAKIHPGIFIHSIYVDLDEKEDRRATFVRSTTLPHPIAASHSLPLETVRKYRRPGRDGRRPAESRVRAVRGVRCHRLLPRFVGRGLTQARNNEEVF